MNAGIKPVIDAALKMAGIKGGKKIVSTPSSDEPEFVEKKSPVTGFKGYPR
jgi:hypothetical protein